MHYSRRIDPLYDEIGRYSVLTVMEERELCRQMWDELAPFRAALAQWQERGSPDGERPAARGEAYSQLILRNLRLASKYANKYRSFVVEDDDLFQQGVLGLIRAAELFDPSYGTRFGTYAVWWIRQYVFRYLQEHTLTVRLPANLLTLSLKYRRLKQEFLSQRHRLPTEREALRRLKCKAQHYQQVIRLDQQTTVSLEEHFGNGWTVGDDLADAKEEDRPFTNLCNLEDREYLLELLRFVPLEHRQILTLRYGLDGKGERTLQVVAEQLNVTRERVRQIEEKGIQALKRAALRTSRGAREMKEVTS